LKTQGECSIVQLASTEVQLSEQQLHPEHKVLASLHIREGEHYSGAFVIENADTASNLKVNGKDPYDKLWLALRDFMLNGQHYRLNEGDVIRFGRAKLCVREIGGVKTTSSVDLSHLVSAKDLHLTEQSGEDEEEPDSSRAICRICYTDTVEALNPLISPCSCDGTMKFIHFNCLKQCLRSRIKIRTTAHVVSFLWHSLDCDLCKQLFPQSVTINGVRTFLVEIPKPESRFIVLELLRKELTAPRGLFLVSLDSNGSVVIGRATENEMMISEISVSRVHASLLLQDNHFYLVDEQGKFGTLVRVRRPLCLDVSRYTTFQAGRTVLELSIKKPWSLLPACFCSRSYPDTAAIGLITPVSVLPMNTGFTISQSNMDLVHNSTARKHKNLFFSHHNVGANSSCEEDAHQQAWEEEDREQANPVVDMPDCLFSMRSFEGLLP
jgi:hypothetical protein